MVVLFHNYQVYRLIFLAGLPSILVHDIVWLMIILSTQGNTNLYASNNLDLFFWSPSGADVLFLLFCGLRQTRNKQQERRTILYVIYSIHVHVLYVLVCVCVLYFCDNKTREACEILCIYLRTLILYLCMYLV